MKFKILITFILQLICFSQVIGQITFQKTYGGPLHESGYAIEQTSDGGYILGGMTKSYGAGDFDLYLVKTNEFGDTLWTRVMGDSHDNRINILKQTSDGGYIITGFTNYDVFLMKTDLMGIVQWRKNYNLQIYVNSVIQTLDGGFVLTGGVYTGTPSRWHQYLIKTDGLGNTSWIKTYGGITPAGAICVIQLSDSSYIFTGQSLEFGSATFNDLSIIKTNSLGDTLWVKNYGIPGEHDFGNNIVEIPGGYMIAGGSSGLPPNAGTFLMKIDLNGNQTWSKAYAGSMSSSFSSFASGIDLHKTTDNGFSINCRMTDVMCLIKADSAGNVQWYHKFSDPNLGSTIMSTGSPTLDGGYVLIGTTDWSGAGGYDMKLIKTDSLGFSGCNEQNLITVATPVNIPSSNYQINVDTLVGTNTPLDLFYNSGGIVSTQCTTVGLDENSDLNSISIEVFPNPFYDEITIKNTFQGGTIILFDATGRKVLEVSTKADETKLSTQNLNQGLYSIQYYFKGKSTSRKLLKLD